MATNHPELEMSWSLFSRILGLRPAIVPTGTDIGKLAPITEAEACEMYGVAPDEFGLYVDFLKMAWAQDMAARDLPEVREETVKKVKKTFELTKHEFTDEERELLALGSFPTSIFDYENDQADRNMEIGWFIERVREVRKIFENPMTNAIARMALLNEMKSRRANAKLVGMDATDKDYNKLQSNLAAVERIYMDQWEQIKELMPGVVVSAERKEQVSHIASLVRMYLEYKSDPANRTRDGVFTDEEIQVMLRSSVQFDGRYRLGWVVSVNESKLGVCDPKWKRQMPMKFSRLLDTSFAFAMKKLTEKLDIRKPDLAGEGEENEYLPLFSEQVLSEGPELQLLDDSEPSVPIQ